jgi:hypothetical protein
MSRWINGQGKDSAAEPRKDISSSIDYAATNPDSNEYKQFPILAI